MLLFMEEWISLLAPFTTEFHLLNCCIPGLVMSLFDFTSTYTRQPLSVPAFFTCLILHLVSLSRTELEN